MLVHNAPLVRGIGVGGGSATPIINKGTFSKLQLHVPPKETWGRIASILSAYDDLIENNKRRIQLLEEAVHSIYKEWFIRFRFPDHENSKIVDGIPVGWVRGTIADLGEIITGGTPSKRNNAYYGQDVPFIKIPDMRNAPIVVTTEESLSIEGAHSQSNKTLPARSILVSCIGTVGLVSMNASIAQTNQQINAIIPYDKDITYWAYFTAKNLQPVLDAMGGGVTMTNVNKTKFSGIPILIPPHKILRKFSSYVLPYFDLIENLLISNIRLATARDLLLPRLMNGEVKV